MPVIPWRIFWIWYYLDNEGKFCYNRVIKFAVISMKNQNDRNEE